MGLVRRWGWAAAAVWGCALLAGRAPRAGEPSAQGLLEEARKAFDRKAYAQAADLAQQVAKEHPDSEAAEEAMVVWVDALVAQGRLSRAYEVCERALDRYPRSKHRTAVLQRELTIGSAIARASVNLYLFRLPRHGEGVAILERVHERAPFGPLADDALMAIAEAHLGQGYYEEAIEQYDRLLKDHPDSPLAMQARIGRALANYRWGAEAPYDSRPAEEARRDYELLSRISGDEVMEQRKQEMADVLARGTYQTGLFYVRRGNLEGAVRYMRAVLVRYPDSSYAKRAQRIIDTVRAAQGEETP